MSFSASKFGVRLSCFLKFAAMAILFSSVAVAQQVDRQGAKAPCGDPTMESTAWRVVTGKVTEIIDANSFTMQYEGNEVLVKLVAVDAPSIERPYGVAAKKFLQGLIGDQQVIVAVSFSAWSSEQKPKQITGVVELRAPGLQDAGLALIRNGLARHKQSKPYTVSPYTECFYRLAEKEARAARRGLWQQ